MGSLTTFAYRWMILYFQDLCPRDMVVYYYSCDPGGCYPSYTELQPYIVDANTNCSTRWSQRYDCLYKEMPANPMVTITADAEALAGHRWSDEELGL